MCAVHSVIMVKKYSFGFHVFISLFTYHSYCDNHNTCNVCRCRHNDYILKSTYMTAELIWIWTNQSKCIAWRHLMTSCFLDPLSSPDTYLTFITIYKLNNDGSHNISLFDNHNEVHGVKWWHQVSIAIIDMSIHCDSRPKFNISQTSLLCCSLGVVRCSYHHDIKHSNDHDAH